MAIPYKKYFKSILNLSTLGTFQYINVGPGAGINSNITLSRIARTAVADAFVHFSQYAEIKTEHENGALHENEALLAPCLSQYKFVTTPGWDDFKNNFAATQQRLNLLAYPFACIRFLKLFLCEAINRLDRHVGNWLGNAGNNRFWFGGSAIPLDRRGGYHSSKIAGFFKALIFYPLSLVEFPLWIGTKILEPLVSPQKTWRAVPSGKQGNVLSALLGLMVAILGAIVVANPALFGLGAAASMGLAYAIGITLLLGGVLASAFCLTTVTMNPPQPPAGNQSGPTGYQSLADGDYELEPVNKFTAPPTVPYEEKYKEKPKNFDHDINDDEDQDHEDHKDHENIDNGANDDESTPSTCCIL